MSLVTLKHTHTYRIWIKMIYALCQWFSKACEQVKVGQKCPTTTRTEASHSDINLEISPCAVQMLVLNCVEIDVFSALTLRMPPENDICKWQRYKPGYQLNSSLSLSSPGFIYVGTFSSLIYPSVRTIFNMIAICFCSYPTWVSLFPSSWRKGVGVEHSITYVVPTSSRMSHTIKVKPLSDFWLVLVHRSRWKFFKLFYSLLRASTFLFVMQETFFEHLYVWHWSDYSLYFECVLSQ